MRQYPPLLPEQIDEAAIRRQLYLSLPIPDLMHWLCEHYGQYQDITLLRLYHKLVRLTDINATPTVHETRRALKKVAIRLHTHRMELDEH